MMSDKTSMLERILERKGNLSAVQKALLEKRLRGEAMTKTVNPGIPKRPLDVAPVLSFAQQRLWFLDQLEPGMPTYNIPSMVRLTGPLQVPLLERSLNEVVRRHEVLRTTYQSVNGEPIQMIAPEWRLPLSVIDLRHLPTAERNERINNIARTEAGLPFDLAKGQVLRAHLLWVEEEEHIMLLTIHHIASDAWGLGLIIQETSAYYEALLSGKSPLLPELPIQYADFAHWQRKWLQGDVLEEQLFYWKQHLGGELPVLQLPTDRQRPAVQRFQGRVHRFSIDSNLTAKLRELGQRAGTTMFMTLLSSLKTLLFRYTGQEDLLVGTPIANRQKSEIEPLIGFFANTLVLRTSMNGDLTFHQLLRQVKEVTTSAYAHQDTPFEKLVDVLQPNRDLSHAPLFQVMFVHFEDPVSMFTMPDLTMEVLDVDSGTSKFDLSFDVLEKQGEIVAKFEYNTDLFDEETIVRMSLHLQNLWQAIVENPDERLSDLPMLSEQEEQQLLVAWNATETEMEPVDFIERFKAQVVQTPSAIAVEFAGRMLTYAELNRQANRLAHRLQRLGVDPEVCVGVCMERSLEMIVSVLAVLKAGGAYIALDPHYPSERLNYMAQDSQIAVLLTQTSVCDVISVSDAVTVLLVDEDSFVQTEAQGTADDEDPATSAAVDSLVYVIYTSGSTGLPKGVAMSKRPLANLVDWQLRQFTDSKSVRVLQFTSLNFDVSFQEIFSTLCSGGTLILVQEELRRDGEQLLRYLEEQRIERLFLPYIALQQLAEAVATNQRVPECLREIITAGEALQMTQPIVEWLRANPACTLFNHYGPSETHVVTAFALQGAEAHSYLPPIGRPIENVRLYILDANRKPLPIGVAGELYIGGVSLARGYLNREDLTAERFLTDPFVKQEGARMYKTGDLVRYLSDGNIEYLGRADDQVKIRGFRIELGEVEKALANFEGVREVVVTAREDVPGQKRLVAYLVLSEGVELVSGNFRAHLKKSLPDYMVPSVFIAMEKLPLTPSGKVNRRALPMPEGMDLLREGEYVEPRTTIESAVADIFSEVLRVPKVGIHDSFFAIGGHSLLATQIISRVNTRFHLRLPLQKLFERPTVAELSAEIQQLNLQDENMKRTPILPIPREEPLPISLSQERMWFLEQLMPGTSTYHMPGAIRLTGRLQFEALEKSIQVLIERHESLRTSFRETESGIWQTIDLPKSIALPVLDWRHVPAEEKEKRLQDFLHQDAKRVFDLRQGPLLRMTFLRMAEQDHVLSVVMHHLIGDGWSLDLFIRELGQLYTAFVDGRENPLPERTIQYADFAKWQREWLQGELLDRHILYWKQQLGGELPVLQLPTVRSRETNSKPIGALKKFKLPKDLYEKLQDLSRTEGTTLYMTLLAAYKMLLFRYTGLEDLLVGSPIAGRNHEDVEPIIGLFVNTIVMRTAVDGSLSFRELLGRVRQVTLEAYDHQDLPFDKLVGELNVPRNLHYSPVFQVMFDLQQNPFSKIELPGLALEQIWSDFSTVKFDMTLAMLESPGELSGFLEYNASLFDEAMIVRFMDHFITLLQGIVANPEGKLSDYPLLTESEEQKLLDLCSANYQIELGEVECLHRLFERQAERTPEATFAVFRQESLTYGEINRLANQVAHVLQKQGVGPEVLVGLCVERSFDMIIGVLGILKAGGAYVPIDPSYPRERMERMMSSCDLSALLVQRSVLPMLPECEIPTFYLDDKAAFAGESTENPSSHVRPEHLAYTIFTSGTTGVPKGVQVQHDTLYSVAKSWMQEFRLDTFEVRLLQFASLSFDVFVADLVRAFINGGTLVICPSEVRVDLEALSRLLMEERITMFDATPGVIVPLLDLVYENKWPLYDLKVLVVGSDLFAVGDYRRLLERFGDHIRIVNSYGITETTIDNSYFEATAITLADTVSGYVPIGRPFPNTRYYILNEKGRLQPTLVQGELYIGGLSVARGYAERPELTAERFLADPFVPGGRLYKTGDLARWNANGVVEILGRSDHQVKIRGFRIELGEIEAVLQKHPDVREAVVNIWEDDNGTKRLAAYLVLQPQEIGLSGGEWRSYVSDALPDYMVPHSFERMEKLPLTPNGKIDRKALPKPVMTLDDQVFVAPRNEVEEILLKLWQEVLGLERLSIHEDFFVAGGHSLLATQLMTRIRKEFQVEVPLRTLFESATIATLSEAIQRLTNAGTTQVAPKINTRSREARRLKQ